MALALIPVEDSQHFPGVGIGIDTHVLVIRAGPEATVVNHVSESLSYIDKVALAAVISAHDM